MSQTSYPVYVIPAVRIPPRWHTLHPLLGPAQREERAEVLVNEASTTNLAHG